ncbi:hypothetical protein FisN_21Lh272 [Fistulifera solaris]|uniref:Uncharacterized protein n=1 Tax=Fistulifera solaris TaxID=1519565 RepID=A0A1Z5KEH0_FISSO|nr:hypothetical protein FisN_21Lh272 [Fistulifera solaris]|eukprot:GAX24627.1 hypothetical protein FisN_21Lh272 [Fistulifera solaris]
MASCGILSSQAFMVTRPSPAIRTSTSLASWNEIVNRFDTIKSAGYNNSRDTTSPSSIVKTAGFSIKSIHNPKLYIALAGLAGLKWMSLFRNPLYYFFLGFCYKWYRARYVFKIPVWDRQPNWNNVITSKEQEKELKAYTCKKCGSTIFIAKSREFFFEGKTGIGGLGCFNCGARGKENFVMDRDRIVEDVADMDDYFEYERPLDFVSRAERRDLLKLTQGDEEKANQILVDRANAQMGIAPTRNAVDTAIVESGPGIESNELGSESEEEGQSIDSRTDTAETIEIVNGEKELETTRVEPIQEKHTSVPIPEPMVDENTSVSKAQSLSERKPKAASKPLRPPPPPANEELDLSELDMDL